MGIFLAYSIKSALCLAAFYLFYKLLLSRETFHRFNRMALLVILALSMIIPFAALSVTNLLEFIPRQHLDLQLTARAGSESTYIEPIVNEPVGTSPINNLLLSVLLIYILGFITFTLRYFKSLYGVMRLIRKGDSTPYGKKNHCLVVHHDSKIAPFSWMKYIVISATDLEDSGEVVLIHERAHLCKGHSVDLIFAEVCLLFQWYNPAAWLLFNELQNVHEYEADQFVLDQGINEEQYQLLIIKKAVGTRLYSIANSFNHSKFKKRIFMMLQRKSNSWARLKYVYVLPLAAIGIVAFAHPEISQPFEEISSVEISHFVSNFKNFEADDGATEVVEAVNESVSAEKDDPQDTTVYMTVERMPEFPEGDAELLKFIRKNTVYPANAAAKGLQGRIKMSFIVKSDGSLSNHKVEGGVDPELDAEALRVIKLLPKFTPGTQGGKAVNVKYSVPVTFKIQDANDTIPAKKSPAKTDKAALLIVEDDLQDPDFVFHTVEVMPEFPGGDVALLEYIKNNIVYPEKAKAKGVYGRISMNFTVEIDGSVSNVIVARNVDPDLDAEAIRVIKSLPKFKPGTQRGKPVRVKYSVPVNFRPPEPAKTDAGKTAPAKTDPAKKTPNTTVPAVIEIIENDVVYETAEVMPEFPGGEVALLKYIQAHTVYPKVAAENGKQGRVMVTFIVKNDGSVSNITVSENANKAFDPELKAEAIRVIGLLPKFKPGTNKGKAINVKYSVPVNFKLNQ